MAKRAIISGVTGQDGSYLAEFLLHLGYEVHGLVRRSSSLVRPRLDHLTHGESGSSRFHLHYAEALDVAQLTEMFKEIQPSEIYNLAAQSHVKVSFEQPVSTAYHSGLSALAMLEAQRFGAPGARFYQASTSELFGSTPPPQNEGSLFHPRSPYGVAKLFAHWSTINYRESYGLFSCAGILFNHESPRRGQSFLTRKVSLAAARIKLGLDHELRLGNMHAVRDWGYAPEFVVGMWKMLQRDTPMDFVLATGEGTSVEDFVSAAFESQSLDWRRFVISDEDYYRPAEVENLIGDPSLAAVELGWDPKVVGSSLPQLMTEADIRRLRGEVIDRISGEEWEEFRDG